MWVVNGSNYKNSYLPLSKPLEQCKLLGNTSEGLAIGIDDLPVRVFFKSDWNAAATGESSGTIPYWSLGCGI